MKLLFVLLTILTCYFPQAQIPDHIYAPNISSVKLYVAGNPLSYPMINLNGGERLELHFDDMDPTVRNYSYTFLLCNADWTPALINQFDYIKGFTQQRIMNYRTSSIAYRRYIHYQAMFPEQNSSPARSGNYLLKVFADGDTSKMLFTRRFLVVEDLVPVGAQIQQPFNGRYFRSHQKIQFSVNTQRLNLVNAMQQINVCILQNNRWDNYLRNIRPTFIRPGSLEFNTEEDALFPGGREWRWLDLRSFRLQSDRVAKAYYSSSRAEVLVVPDGDRSQQRFVLYKDNNGMFYNDVLDGINPFWQADYATAHFAYVPPGKTAFDGRDVYLFGELTGYGDHPAAKMNFNSRTGMYETSLLLKQGYYDYAYVTVEGNSGSFKPSFDFTEGNFWDTENNYTILVYYRALGDRSDKLVGISRLNTLTARPSF
ncbi:MAG: DUF5103 domain-containing protein [Chitinophagaceae bacterium]|nr:DUF5103 domain-containing protein [Chitinophagaceae bacterium]